MVRQVARNVKQANADDIRGRHSLTKNRFGDILASEALEMASYTCLVGPVGPE
jgi:hypothetical protein